MWLKNEKTKSVVNISKVQKFEKRLAEIKQRLEAESRYIMLNFKIDINQLMNNGNIK
ncbi:MAG: hypothetical protein IKZ49_02425 [Alphaproteobacteria bacterium]|nr:hypothetical protein [Alphaproteobacteria bacterium]